MVVKQDGGSIYYDTKLDQKSNGKKDGCQKKRWHG
jgi:hypothetical protein